MRIRFISTVAVAVIAAGSIFALAGCAGPSDAGTVKHTSAPVAAAASPTPTADPLPAIPVIKVGVPFNVKSGMEAAATATATLTGVTYGHDVNHPWIQFAWSYTVTDGTFSDDVSGYSVEAYDAAGNKLLGTVGDALDGVTAGSPGETFTGHDAFIISDLTGKTMVPGPITLVINGDKGPQSIYAAGIATFPVVRN